MIYSSELKVLKCIPTESEMRKKKWENCDLKALCDLSVTQGISQRKIRTSYIQAMQLHLAYMLAPNL